MEGKPLGELLLNVKSLLEDVRTQWRTESSKDAGRVHAWGQVNVAEITEQIHENFDQAKLLVRSFLDKIQGSQNASRMNVKKYLTFLKVSCFSSSYCHEPII
jgi:hypothetical protein